MQCKAKSRSGERCKNPAVEGRDVCRKHGGLSLAGPAHPSFKHGKRTRARYIPERYAAAVHRAMIDPALLELRPQLALLEAREEELLRDIADGDSSANRKRMIRLATDRATERQRAQEARSRGDEDGARDHLRRASELADEVCSLAIAGGKSDEVWRDDILNLIEAKRKAADSERKRIESERQYMTTQETVTMLARVTTIFIEAIATHVSNRSDARMAQSAALLKIGVLRDELLIGASEDGVVEEDLDASAS